MSTKRRLNIIPIKTVNGEITDESLEYIQQLTGDEIKEINTISQMRNHL